MHRSTSFGVGVTLVMVGLAIYSFLKSLDPADNIPIAILFGCAGITPGSILIGRAIWPPERT